MTRQLDVDRLLESWLAEGPAELPDRVVDNILSQLDLTEKRKPRWLPRRLTMNRTIFAVGSAAALVVAMLAFAYYSGNDGFGSPTPQATPLRQTVLPSSSLVWSVDGAEQDWPVTPRLEPNADPVVASALSGQELCALHPSILSSVVLNGVERCSHGPFIEDYPESPERVYIDSSDEPTLESNSFLDIRAVGFREECWFKPATCVYFDTVERVARPLPHPQEQWIAFGVVADTNGDGQPDLRYGIDNAPAPIGEVLGTEFRLRMWRTDLLTGETSHYSRFFEVPSVMDAIFPGESGVPLGPTIGRMYAHREGGSPFRFYVWASLIRDGQLVATDYAPDAGWLEAE